MRIKILQFLLFVLCFQLISGCKKSVDERKTYSPYKILGSSGDDGALCLESTKDGGFIISGFQTVSERGWDALLVKTDAEGNVAWSKTYGGSRDDYFTTAIQTADGGFIATGASRSFNKFDSSGSLTEEPKFYALKTNASGEIEWEHTYAVKVTNDGPAFGAEVIEETDASYSFLVSTSEFYDTIRKDYVPSTYLVKLSKSGEKLTETNVFSKMRPHMGSGLVSMDNGDKISILYMAGPKGRTYLGLTRINTQGMLVWEKSDIPYDKNMVDNSLVSHPLCKTADGGVFVVISEANGKATAMNADGSGNIVYSAVLNFGYNAVIKDCEPVADGYYLTGFSMDKGNKATGMIVAKTDLDGRLLWNKIFGVNAAMRGYSLKQGPDNTLNVVCTTFENLNHYSDIIFLKTDLEGNVITTK